MNEFQDNEASACRLSSAVFGACINVRDFGADGSANKDDSGPFQKALDSCAASSGGIVRAPAGQYRLDNPIVVPTGVSLAGDWRGPHFSTLECGTIILACAGRGKEDDLPLISLASDSTIEGLTIFHPDQRLEDVHPYPWTIQGEGTHCNVIDVTLVNPYKGIDFGTHRNQLHYIRNVYGCPLKIGVYIDRCTDIGRVENVHFNPNSWGRIEAPNTPNQRELIGYLFDNCTSFVFGRSDWEYVLNTFSFGCKVGYHFLESEAGACNGNFLGIGADWARTAVLVEESQPYGLLITNGEFVGGKGAETAVEVTARHTGLLQFSNCAFWGHQQAIVQAAGGMVSLSQCNLYDWDTSDSGAYAVTASGGCVSIMGCRFGRRKNHVSLQPGVETAVVSGNTFTSSISIHNVSQGCVEIGGNVSPVRTSSE